MEPLAACVYFLPENTDRYTALGLDRRPAYFASRGGCMGQVPGQVVTAAFGVFNPDVVVPAVDEAWAKTDVATLLAAREAGAVAGLSRILGPSPEGATHATAILRRCADAADAAGRHIFAGLRSLGYPGSPLGDLWRAADLVREHRGDSHIAAWISHGIGPIEAQLLLELWWRMPLGPYTSGRGWTDEQIAGSWAGLVADGMVSGGLDSSGAFTPAGEALRASIEEATDRQESSIVDALGDDADALFALLEPWSAKLVAAGAYPVDPATRTRP